jgi:hypothetical protein
VLQQFSDGHVRLPRRSTASARRSGRVPRERDLGLSEHRGFPRHERTLGAVVEQLAEHADGEFRRVFVDDPADLAVDDLMVRVDARLDLLGNVLYFYRGRARRRSTPLGPR